MARWHLCNVLQVGADARRVWQFDARNGGFPLSGEEAVAAGQPLPASLVAKSWRSLWQRKLNVAWLPPESVFLRVVPLPPATFAETVSMVELQLEKLSPLPVTQVVWSAHVLAGPAAARSGEAQSAPRLQTVVVLFAERKSVEEFLGRLESDGYLADRLEIPALDQLQATAVSEDGAWIYPEAAGGRNTALVAWWCDGTLQNLNLISFPAAGDRAAGLRGQLAQIAWAGELEGWLTRRPAWHLVADEAQAAEWEPALRQALEEPIRVNRPLPPAELAGRTAQRAAAADPASNLLPAEFVKRYQLQFQDRLWLRGLATLLALYVVAVLVYFLALGGLYLRAQSVENQVKALSNTYTNAIQLKARYQVLQDRQDLKFAALDCWRAVAETIPDALTLESLTFSDGRRLNLNGTAPAGEGKSVVDFFDQVRKSKVGNQPLFDTSQGDSAPRSSTGPGGAINWNFTLELKRVESQ
jgi:hypothetical protein